VFLGGLLAVTVAAVLQARQLGEPYDDAQLEADARERLERNPRLRRLPIRVAVRGGVARLEGEVESLELIEAARRAVAGVRGLVDLQGALAVPRHLADDGRLADDLKRIVERYPRLQGTSVEWSVQGGEARAHGRVRTAGERRLILEGAREVRGLRSVELLLQVAEGADRADDVLERQVRGLLSDRLRFPIQGRVQVRVRERIASLEGTVQRVIDKLEAEEVAWFVGGVQGVHNHIQVLPRLRLWRPGEARPDVPGLSPDQETPEDEAEGEDAGDAED